ncbi:MAG: tripartite tricarboxylate transporter permease [Spirochaetales bacterium]|jgi:putative tricarboxylic transport membrane protein|nr:tripartite tricarboxylate transporter permease [Spirochaetales bacterium]
METLSNLLMGFHEIFNRPELFLYCFGGIVIGQVVGILPGLGAVVTIAVLLPFTYSLDPAAALIAFCGIYYGCMFGGAISSILVNAPGTEAAVMTAVEGYPMARRGEAGKALATAAISSFVGGILGSIGVVALSSIIVKLIISFAAPEYLALLIFAMACITGMAEEASMSKTIFAIGSGLAIGTIGLDASTGSTARMTFGVLELYEGVNFAIMAIGMFALAEVFRNISSTKKGGIHKIETIKVNGRVGLSLKDWKYILPSQLRGTLIGFFIGVLPGVGAATATPLSYAIERKVVGNKNARWGDGEIRGVAIAETSDNACAMGALMPLLTIGIPGSSAAAIMLTAFMILGIQPGPLMMIQNPDILWSIIASFFIGNTLLLIINLPLVRYCIKIVQVPTDLLFMAVYVLSVVGGFSINMRVFDIGIVVILAVVSIVYTICKIPLAPMLVAILLGDMIEANLARTFILCNHNMGEFLARPVVLLFLGLSVLVILLPAIRRLLEKKEKYQTA